MWHQRALRHPARILIAGEHTVRLYASKLHGVRQNGLLQAQKVVDPCRWKGWMKNNDAIANKDNQIQ